MRETHGKDTNRCINNNGLIQLTGLKGFRFSDCNLTADGISATVSSKLRTATCPLCGKRSSTVHSYYIRTVTSLPMHGMTFRLFFHARRFRCRNPDCRAETFSEQPSSLTSRYGRRSRDAESLLQALLMEVSGRKGSLQSRLIGLPVSPSTALRIVRRVPLEEVNPDSVTHLCIDDFAYRKGIKYGTIFIDADTRRFIELVDGRDSVPVAKVLGRYHNLETITRDRSNAFAKAIKDSIPSVNQIADKFHLVMNASKHADKQIRMSFADIRKEVGDKTGNQGRCAISGKPSEHVKEVFRRVHELHEKGMKQREMERQLGIDHKTIQKYLALEEAPGKKYKSKVDYVAYILTIREGIKHNMAPYAIHRMCQEEGLNVSFISFRRWFKNHFPEYVTPLEAKKRGVKLDNSRILKPDNAKSLDLLYSKSLPLYVCNPDWGVDKKTGECTDEHIMMNDLIVKSPTLLYIRKAYVSFRELMSGGLPDALDGWIEEHEKSDLNHIKSFATGLKKDVEAIKNAIRYQEFSNGITEGFNNKLKAIKRSMYGRAKKDLMTRKLALSMTG